MMKLINRLAIMIAGISCLMHNVVEATKFWAVNESGTPVVIRVKYKGETNWGSFCTLCPDEWLLSGAGQTPNQDEYNMKMQTSKYFIDTGLKLVKRIEIYYGFDKLRVSNVRLSSSNTSPIIGKDVGSNIGLHGVYFGYAQATPYLNFK
jgi:hypothetical protein